MAREKMKYVINKFYPYFWHKFKFPVEVDAEPECEEFIEGLREAVWVHRIVSFRYWYPFVETNLIPMTSSPEMFVSCVFFMISTTIQTLHNRYEPFITTCSLVTAVAAYLYDKGYHEFLDYSPIILIIFFEEFHEEVFQKFKIWDHLQEYLISNNYSDAYNIVEKKTKRNPFADINLQLDFVREINLKINSKIPVSEHAAVYQRTQEVLKRFETVGMGTESINQPTVDVKRSLHKIAKGSWDDSEKEIDKSPSKQSAIGNERTHVRRVSLKEMKRVLEDLKIQTILKGELGISAQDTEDKNLKISPSKSKEPLQETSKPLIVERKGIFVTKENEVAEVTSKKRNSLSTSDQSLQKDTKPRKPARKQSASAVNKTSEIYLKQVSSCQLEQQSLQEDSKKPRTDNSTDDILQLEVENVQEEQSASTMESTLEIDLKQASSLRSEEHSLQKYVERPRTADSEQSTFSLAETEEINLKQNSSFQSEEQSLQDDEIKPRTEDREQSSSAMEEIGEINLKQISSCQLGQQSLQEDAKKSRTDDSEQSASAMEEIVEIDLKQDSSYKLEEQSLQDDMKKLRVKDSEYNIPIESNSNNIVLDDIPQLEAENVQEENYSDTTLHETTDSNQSAAIASKTSSKKRKKRLKSKQQKVTDPEMNSQVPSLNESTSTSKDIDEKEAVQALVVLFNKSTKNLRDVYDLLEIPRDI